MALDLSCIKYTNRRLFVSPIYGRGWDELDVVSPQETHNGVLQTFHIKVRLFMSLRSNRRGQVLDSGIGVVEETNHLCNNFSIIFRSRSYQSNQSNMTNRVGSYDIDLGNTEDKMFRGFAYIGEAPENIRHHLDNNLKLCLQTPKFVDHELRAEIEKLLQDFTLRNSHNG